MFWTDRTRSGEKWREGSRWRLVENYVTEVSLVLVLPPGMQLRSTTQYGIAETYRAFRLNEAGQVERLLCEADTLEECQAVALALYRMEEP